MLCRLPNRIVVPEKLPPKGKALNEYTWEEIGLISTAGVASEYFAVGDCKEITLNGAIGNGLTLSNYTTYAYIIGINHNASAEGENLIHFQLGKTALSGGTNIALCDSKYSSTYETTGYFSMRGERNNTGGWESSQMRTNICGTSLTDYSGTIIGAIPEELRAVLQPVTKYTNNVGNSTEASAVTATTDYFFLLSEHEVFGSASYGNANESSKQAQYDYYSAGNSKIKYRHDVTSNAAKTLLRSPAVGSSESFVSVYTDGRLSSSPGSSAGGFAPGFCV